MVTLSSLVHSLIGCFGQSEDPSDHRPPEGIPAISYGDPPSPLLLENCTICMSDFVIGDKVRLLPNCRHVFHEDCIDQWLPTRSSRCPNCRDLAIEREVEPASRDCAGGGNDGSSLPPLLLHFPSYGLTSSYL